MRKQYGGGPLYLYQASNVVTDSVTGIKSSDKTVTEICRVVVLPAKVSREAVQSISLISSNKAFVYGGTFDSRARTFIVDKNDVPDIEEINQDDWLVFDGNKYELKRIEEFGYAWVLIGRQLLGNLKEQVFPLAADNMLDISVEVTDV